MIEASLKQRCTSGLLWKPFGWATDHLAPIVLANSALSIDLLSLDRARLHLIALTLDIAGDAVTDRIVTLAMRASFRDVFDGVIGYRPLGLNRVLHHLPDRVLQPTYYRQLVQLLANAEAARILNHSHEIDATLIDLLSGVPAGLRRVVMASSINPLWHRLARFADSLALLVARGVAPNFDALVADLMTARVPGQFAAKIRALVDTLPLPDAMPPARIGPARRLDAPSDILRLSKQWHDCLAGYLTRVDDGQAAIYLDDDSVTPTVCLVERAGRFGWVVDDIKGPNNINIDGEIVVHILLSFAAADIPAASVIQPLQTILMGCRPAVR